MMLDARKNAIYEAVEIIHGRHPLTSRNPDSVKAVCLTRQTEIEGRFSEPEELLLAQAYSELLFRRELSQLEDSDTAAEIERWQVVRDNDFLGGSVELGETLSDRGATSEVRKAYSKHTDRALAIKYLVPNKITENYQRIALALAEMQNLFRIRHPNVVHVYDAGWLRSPVGQQIPFVMMEYLDGCTLDVWAEARRSANADPQETARQAVEITRVLARAVHSLHAEFGKPIWHLDLKPANVMVVGGILVMADRLTIKIIDFGSFGGSSADTQVGTRPYMAPERQHLPASSASAAWDVFSLGAILYFLTVGSHPALDETNQSPVFDYSQISDSDLRAICQKATAADKNVRYRTAQQLEQDLKAWANDEPIPHLGWTYSWWQREKLLWKRGRKYNNVADHQQIIGRTATVVAAAAIATASWHTVQVVSGVDPAKAYYWSINSMNAFCFLLFATCAWSVRFRAASFKILEPLLAIVIASIGLQHCISPRIYMSFPTWEEEKRIALSVLLMVAIVNISFGALSSEWKPARWVGWTTLLMTFLLRPLFDSRLSSLAMPIVILSTEAFACLVFASCIVTKRRDDLPSARSRGNGSDR